MEVRLFGGPGAVKVRVRGLVTFSGASSGTISNRFLHICAVSGVGGGGAGAVKKKILTLLHVRINFLRAGFFGVRY